MKIVIGLVVAAACAFGGYWAFFRGGPSADEAPKTRTVKVKRAKVVHAIETNGEVRPAYSIELKSKASGQIILFDKVEGETVSTKDVLVELDQIVEKRNLERAQAELDAATARREQANAEYDRAIAMENSILRVSQEDDGVKKAELERMTSRTGSSITQKEMDAAKLAATAAAEKVTQVQDQLTYLTRKKKADDQLNAATVRQAEVALREAEDRMADTRLRPPIDGILLKKMVTEGQIVSSGISNVGGGTTIAVIADVSRLIVLANVVESDVGKVAMRQKARVSAAGSPDKKFDGEVIHIPPQSDVEEGITYFKVQVAVTDRKAIETLKVGMTANVELIVKETEGEVTAVPSEAVISEGGKRFVKVKRGEAEEKIEVEIGLDSGLDCEIVKGLKEGDEILVPVMEGEGMFGRNRRSGRRR